MGLDDIENVKLTETYQMGKADGSDYILCLRCDRKSFSQGDIDNLYCGLCGYHNRQIITFDNQD